MALFARSTDLVKRQYNDKLVTQLLLFLSLWLRDFSDHKAFDISALSKTSSQHSLTIVISSCPNNSNCFFPSRVCS